MQDDETVTYRTDVVATPKWLSNYWLIAAALIASQGSVLFYLGQPVISRTGGMKLWCGDVLSRENSQHLTDWYTFTHIIHGIGYYWILGMVTPRASMPFRFIVAVAMEVLWEIIENTPMVINRYRRTALANGYSGDSIVNSISDTLAMLFGFYMSRALPSPIVIAYTVLSELFCAMKIRDNLTLNLIQLIHPVESISNWQTDYFNNSLRTVTQKTLSR